MKFSPLLKKLLLGEALKRRAARKRLAGIGGHVLQRSFSVEFVRVPRGRKLQRKRGLQRIFHYERSTPAEKKTIERLLRIAHPELNRKERRHLARKHRYLFVEGLHA